MAHTSNSGTAEWVLDLVHQGLLPLSTRSLLTARLVCKRWQQSLSQDHFLTHLTLPYDAWATTSASTHNSAARLARSSQQAAAAAAADQTGWRSAATAAAAALEAAREEEDEDAAAAAAAAALGKAAGVDRAGAAAAVAGQRKRARGHNKASKGLSAAAAAAAAEDLAAASSEPANMAQVEQQQAEQEQAAAEPLQDGPAAMLLDVPTSSAAAAAVAALSSGTCDTSTQPQQHPLHLLPSSLPAVTQVSLSNRRSAWYDPQATSGPSVISQAVALLSDLPKLSSICVQGYIPAADWHPLLSALAGPQQQQQQPAGLQGGSLGQAGGKQETAADAADDVAVDASQRQQHVQQQQQEHVQYPASPQQQQQQQQLSLCSRLISLDLQALELPQRLLLEAVLLGLRGLRCLRLHASMESILEGAHLEALASGTQLTSLELTVYQTAHSRCPLDPLLELTRLQHLDVAYGGIFNDQRPALTEPSSMSRLVQLTCLASRGLAQPLLPQPNIATLRSLRVSGLTKRLAESNVQLISSCSSSALQDLRLEGGRRGIAAVAADQLDHLGFMTQLTSLSLALSKGSLPAGKSAQQLQKLAGLTSLKTLWLGSGDHRLGLSTEQLQELGQQWPSLDTLRLSGFSPLQGFSGLGAFTGLTALSMKPGVGTGKVLLELDLALQQLSKLRRLHLDFRSSLQLEHVEAITAACASRLQHLSLNMWAPGIGSKALVSIGQLSVLTSLQLMNMRAAVLSGPPGIIALREMPSLELLCVQAADEVITDQQPLSLGGYLSEVLSGPVGPLREVRVWLGSGVEARHAEAGVAAVVQAELPDCRCRVLKEPEKAVL